MNRIHLSQDAGLKELGLSNTSLGSAFSAFSITYACFMIVGGRLADAIGSRFGLALSGVLWGIGTIATGLVGGWPRWSWRGSSSARVSLPCIRSRPPSSAAGSRLTAAARRRACCTAVAVLAPPLHRQW
ncbi:MAG: MFS transporter [Bradyrhizobium sp.]|nr:MFS transporter [Bradyrhizobium sp.]